MERDEARQKVLAIRRLILGHPPGDPVENIEKIRNIVSRKATRSAKTGTDRKERSGFDRSE